MEYKTKELQLVCTNDGVAWWQEKHRAKTHISNLFRGPVPTVGDLIIHVVDDDMKARKIKDIKKGVCQVSNEFRVVVGVIPKPHLIEEFYQRK